MKNTGLHIKPSKRSLISGGCPSWCGSKRSIISGEVWTSPLDNIV